MTNIEAILFAILQVQCIFIFFFLWRMRQKDNKFKVMINSYREYSKNINSTIDKFIPDMDLLVRECDFEIRKLAKRLENTEKAYKELESRFNKSEIVYTSGCDANGSDNFTIVKTIIEKENENNK